MKEKVIQIVYTSATLLGGKSAILLLTDKGNIYYQTTGIETWKKETNLPEEIQPI